MVIDDFLLYCNFFRIVNTTFPPTLNVIFMYDRHEREKEIQFLALFVCVCVSCLYKSFFIDVFVCLCADCGVRARLCLIATAEILFTCSTLTVYMSNKPCCYMAQAHMQFQSVPSTPSLVLLRTHVHTHSPVFLFYFHIYLCDERIIRERDRGERERERKKEGDG